VPGDQSSGHDLNGQSGDLQVGMRPPNGGPYSDQIVQLFHGRYTSGIGRSRQPSTVEQSECE
jgi:hypothetical protein